MKKLLFVVGIVVVLSAFIFSGCAAPAPAPAPTPAPTPAPAPKPAPSPAPAPTPAPAKPIEIVASNPFPQKDPPNSGLMEPMANEIMKRTNGRVKIEIFHGGAMGKTTENAALVEKGTVGMAVFMHDHSPDRFPLSRGIDLPFLFSSAKSGSATAWDLYEAFPEIRAEHKNMKVIGLYTYDANQVHMVTKPIRTLEDFKGMVIRGTGPVMGEMISLFGATPSAIAVTELYSSLERKVVDGTFFSFSGAITYKLGEVVKYTTVCNSFVGSGAVAINQDVWNSLPPDIQKTIEEVAKEFRLGGGAKYDEISQQGKEELKKLNREIITLPADELARWKKIVQPMYDKWAKDIDGKGQPGTAVLQKLLQSAEKNNKAYP